jgi:hypothetical protein
MYWNFFLEPILYGYFVLVILWLKANSTIPLLSSCWMSFTNRAIEDSVAGRAAEHCTFVPKQYLSALTLNSYLLS